MTTATDTDALLDGITIPDDPAAFQEWVTNGDNLKGMFDDKGAPTPKFGALLKAYGSAFAAKQRGAIDEQIAEQVQATVANMLRDAGVFAEVNRANSRADLTRAKGLGLSAKDKGQFYREQAPGARADGLFDSAIEFLQACWHGHNQLGNADELNGKLSKLRKIQNDYGTLVPSDGGFLVPEQFRTELMYNALETAVVRPRAMVIPMDSGALTIPTVDETTHASGSLFGGIVFYWVEEGGTPTESQAKFGQVTLRPHKLVGLSEANNELIADSPAFNSFVSQVWPAGWAWSEDVAFLRGSGVGQPLGVLDGNNGGLITVTATASGNDVQYADVANMVGRILPASFATSVWVASHDSMPDLLTMELSSGSPAVWVNNLAQGPTMSLLGRPLFFTEKVPANGTAGQLSLIDFGHYLVGDRAAMQLSSSTHAQFAADKTVFKLTGRIDGRPWLQSPLTPYNGGDTISPYVTLGAD